MDFWKDAVVPVLAAAIGTGAGATVAFLIERTRKTAAAEDEHVAATNAALFAVFRIVNDLENYKRTHVDPRRADTERWYTLPPTKLPAPPNFDVASLGYLFELPGDAPTLPMAIHVGIGMYESIFEAANERYRIHMHEVQPALEMAILNKKGGASFKSRVDAALGGSRVTDTMQVITNELIELIDLTLEYIPKHAVWLRDVAKQRYPNRQIVQLLIRDPDPSSTRPNETGVS